MEKPDKIREPKPEQTHVKKPNKSLSVQTGLKAGDYSWAGEKPYNWTGSP